MLVYIAEDLLGMMFLWQFRMVAIKACFNPGKNSTVKTLKIGTPKKIAVIIPKLEQNSFTTE